MTRHDYIAIAAAIKSSAYTEDSGATLALQRESIARNIAEVMAADNSRFNVSKFLEACGV